MAYAPEVTMTRPRTRHRLTALLLTLALGCATHRPSFHDRNMDFGSIKTVAVLPFWNLTSSQQAADRVREVFANALLATQAVYVLPSGEVGRAVGRLGLASATTPTVDEVAKLGAMLKVDAVITGVVKEYGEVRAATATSNVVSVSLQMHETGTGKVVWAGASTKGGVGWSTRLLGTGGGEPMNAVTEQAVDDLLRQLFQ
jgi:hypothetical protein